jgi:hypothetical protein
METMAGPQLGVRGWVMAAGLTASLAAGCQCPPEQQTTTQQPTSEPTAWQADCQQDSILILVRTDSGAPYDTVTASDMPLIEPIANLPEYHDCQRFVVPTTGNVAGTAKFMFGPLVAIWAADNLGGRFGDPRAPGPSLAVPVAMIHNFDNAVTYEALQIRPGFSCLYLWHDGGKPRRWNAAIVSLGPRTGPCQEVVDPRAVHPAPLPQDLGPDDVPEVARWDWDPRREQQHIGIRCADQWCDVGSPGLTPSRSALQAGMTVPTLKSLVAPIAGITNGQGKDNEDLRVISVKGWYDEQRLDTMGTNGKPILTEIVGTVFPHPALERAKFIPGDWTPVAIVNVTADYPGKVRLRQGMSRLFLCREEESGECKVTPATPIACDPEDPDPASPTAVQPKWWMKIVSQGNEVAYHCVKRRRHGGRAIPAAAARWNWNELDAKTWVACEGGCCTVN